MDKKTLLLAVAACSMIQLHAENITFSDSKVKALCVQHWDSNKDGELSTDEAAAVTSLGSVFRGNKTITSFEELRHFTGLAAIDDYVSRIGHYMPFATTVIPELKNTKALSELQHR